VALTIVENTGRTDVGRQRTSNEDAFLDSSPLFGVADGMGGARAGEVAARIAVETLADGGRAGGAAEERLAKTAREANRKIYELAQADDSRTGMGTTFTAVLVENADVVAGHVGDSRLYRYRDDRLERLTRDHSLVEELVRRGELDPQEAGAHPQRSIITRALGPEPDVEVETFTTSGRDGDVYLVCSDGLTTMVSEDRVAELLRERESLEAAAERLVAAANDAGGKDNITVVLFRLGEGPATAGTEDSDTLSGQDTRVDLDAEEVRETASRAERAGGARATATRPGSRPRRASARRRLTAAVALVFVAALVVGFYFGSRQFYFVGTNERGLVTLYRGVPYELPLGVELYGEEYVSTVPASSIHPAGRRDEIIDHRLREEGDAVDLMRQLEEGRLSS
jgi:serine/threonine protein phosphatase PrpC